LAKAQKTIVCLTRAGWQGVLTYQPIFFRLPIFRKFCRAEIVIRFEFKDTIENEFRTIAGSGFRVYSVNFSWENR